MRALGSQLTDGDVNLILWFEFALAVGLIAMPWPWGTWLSATNAPAWVQGIGSVLAIFVAVAIPRIAADVDRRRASAAALSLARMLAEAIELYVITIGAKPAKEGAQADTARHQRELVVSGLLDAMAAISADKLPNEAAVAAYFRLIGLGKNVVKLVSQVRDDKALVDLRDVLLAVDADAQARLGELEDALRP